MKICVKFCKYKDHLSTLRYTTAKFNEAIMIPVAVTITIILSCIATFDEIIC